ncbi:hypothetical protein ILYODFUR_024530 [Ilyodon furcidens]|uniref:Uncharacterized protein n=1 Tax=Ilyodon furcidens TaxID=33524 RepID=A0ABV0V7X8_9TELE
MLVSSSRPVNRFAGARDSHLKPGGAMPEFVTQLNYSASLNVSLTAAHTDGAPSPILGPLPYPGLGSTNPFVHPISVSLISSALLGKEGTFQGLRVRHSTIKPRKHAVQVCGRVLALGRVRMI